MAADAVQTAASPQALQGLLLLVLLTAASFIDLRQRIIPDELCLAVALTGLLRFAPGNLLGLLAALPLFAAALLWGGMGGGDIKLTAAIGVVLGFSETLAALVLGSSAELLVYGLHCLARRLRGKKLPGLTRTAYPLAPFLAAGCLIVYWS